MEEYFVEKIVNKKRVKGKVLYLVRWENYSEEHDTWEPPENLGNCKAMIEEFEKKEEEKRVSQKQEVEENLNRKRKRTIPTSSKSSQVKAALEQRESKKKKLTENTEENNSNKINFSGITKLLTQDDAPSKIAKTTPLPLDNIDLNNKIDKKLDIKSDDKEKYKKLTNSLAQSNDGVLLTDRQKEKLMCKSAENVGIITYTEVDEQSKHLFPDIPLNSFKSMTDSMQSDEYSLDSSSLQCAPKFNRLINGDEYVQIIRNLQPNSNVISQLSEKQLLDIQKRVVRLLQGVTVALDKIVN